MESELDLLLRTAIDSLVKLEVVLYLHQRAGGVQSAAEVSARLRRPEAEVARALEELSEVELIARFPLGSGRHVIYGASEDAHVQALLDVLRAEYEHDAGGRARIIGAILRSNETPEAQPQPPS